MLPRLLGSDILEYGTCFTKIAKNMSSLTGNGVMNYWLGTMIDFIMNLECGNMYSIKLLSVLDRDANLSGSWHVTAIE